MELKTKKSLKFFLIAVFLVNTSLSVTIRSFHIPTYFNKRKSDSLILDCDYVYNENDLKLIVRWFFGNIPEPIYQWIPEMDLRHISTFLKPYIDKDYVTHSSDPYTKYRAIKINNPSTHLSGNYVCDISSLAGQDIRANFVNIFVSPEQFEFNYKVNQESGELELECIVAGVYPQPIMSLSEQSSLNATQSLITMKNIHHHTSYDENTSLYETKIFYKVTEANMIKIRSSKFGTVLECEYSIPNTTFTGRKRIALYPNVAASTSNALTRMRNNRMVILFLFTILSCRLSMKNILD